MTAPVSIEPAAIRGLAVDLGNVVLDVDRIAVEAQRDDGAGMLDGMTGVATGQLVETVEELGLAARLLRSIADAATFADAGFVGLESGAQASVTAAAISHQLLTSLSDGVGHEPADAIDPELANDHADPLGHFGWMPLFGPNGPVADDVDQGQVGDCWMLASFASIAAEDPDRISDLITEHGDGTYTVHFADGDVTVDDQLPYRVGADGVIRPLYVVREAGIDTPIWPAIVEKAQAIRMGGDYDDISGDWAETAFASVGSSTTRLDLNPRFRRDPSDTSVAERLIEQLDADLAVTANSFGAFGMGGGHAWTVLEVADDAAGDTWVTVRNPWGTDGIAAVDGVLRYGNGDEVEFANEDHAAHVRLDGTGDGVISMRIDVFTANFRNIEFMEADD